MNLKQNSNMKALKATLATLIMTVIFIGGLSAQSLPQVAIFDNVGSHNENGNLHLTWTNLIYDNADYFLVEKLDENWEYVEVGKLKASPLEVIYSIEDTNAVLGENYYRITVITELGDVLESELLIGDHFMEEETFSPINNNSLVAFHSLKNVLKGSELLDTAKYNKHQMQMARIKSTASFTETYTSTMVASIDFLD